MAKTAIANINMNNALGSMVGPNFKEDAMDLKNLNALDDDDVEILEEMESKWGGMIQKFNKFDNLYKKMTEWHSRKQKTWMHDWNQQATQHALANTWITTSSTNTSTVYPMMTASSTGNFAAANVYITSGNSGQMVQVGADLDSFDAIGAVLKLHAGMERIIELPDGSKLYLDKDGNYKLDDKDSKVVHKATNIKEFNKYMNASDLIEEFIADVGKMGITQGQLLKLPINVFFVWLVFKAAEKDGEQPPADVPKLECLPEVKQNFLQPKCKCCGKYIQKQVHSLGVNFCSSEHMQIYMDRHLIRA